jgi:hypothetical protein
MQYSYDDVAVCFVNMQKYFLEYICMIRGSSVSIVTRLRVARSGFDSRQGQRYFSLR